MRIARLGIQPDPADSDLLVVVISALDVLQGLLLTPDSPDIHDKVFHCMAKQKRIMPHIIGKQLRIAPDREVAVHGQKYGDNR